MFFNLDSNYKLICKYCDYKWDDYLLTTSKPICPRCNDKNIKKIRIEKAKQNIFGYEENVDKEDEKEDN